MDVVMHSAGLPFDGTTVSRFSLGGSESAAYYLAREMARRGHRVKVFTSQQEPQESQCDGVTYIWHGAMTESAPLGERFEHYARNTPHDLLIVQRLPHAFHRRYAAKVCIWQLHDLALYRLAPQVIGGTWQIDAITTVSEWHRQQVLKVWSVNPDFVHVVPNGVDPELYAPRRQGLLQIERSATEPPGLSPEDLSVLFVPPERFVLLYQSRPERGLEYALDLMDRAKITGLPLHLIVCGYENTTPHMAPLYERLRQRMASMSNVTNIGSLAKPALAELQRQCDLLLYPTVFDEVSCITAMEAMHAGLPMLTSAHAALPETCADSGTHLIPPKDGHPDLDAFDSWLQTVFGLVQPGQYPEELTRMRAAQFKAATTRTWERATDALLALYEARIKARRSSHGAILRDAIEHSDIGFAEWYAERNAEEIEQDSVARHALQEIRAKYAFKNSAEAYAAHYAYHQGKYYDDFESRAIGEDVTHTTRFRGTWHFLMEHVRRRNSGYLRVLDYGCAHGHYLIPLAKSLPTCDFIGVDISERAIAAARKWTERDRHRQRHAALRRPVNPQRRSVGRFRHVRRDHCR
ncbi:MAG: glycosyltransferase [Burkholderiaceae bacterium]|nr:glycosyltransferase [Burkholderiaceae bacterium]